MSCPSCGHENPSDARFCGQCGTPLPREVECKECGRENRADLNFCVACGADLKVQQQPAAQDECPKELANGRYKVERYLGEGGRKRVYLAHDTMLDRDVALALVKTQGLDEEGRIRVHREAQSMAKLGDHPNVVTVYDIGDEKGEPYIVSQYMAGGALDALLQNAQD